MERETLGRLSAVGMAVLILAMALVRTATASHDASHKAFSGGSGFKGLVVKTDTDQTQITAVKDDWQDVDSRGFQLAAGESQLIVVDFFVVTQCEVTTPPSNGGSHACSARALVGRTVGSALAMEPSDGLNFALDSVGGAGNPQGHAMSQALCVRNPESSPLNISVFLEAAKGDPGQFFVIDDWTFKISRNAPCSPAVNI